MTVYTYDYGEHGGGFVGLRVAVMVEGKLHQRYFSVHSRKSERFSDEVITTLTRQAHQLNDQWVAEKTRSIEKRKQDCQEIRVTDNLYTTGVRGIKMKYVVYKRGSKKKSQCLYYTPMFVVSGAHNGKRFQKKFNILSQGYTNAWTFAVLYYAMQKNLPEPGQLTKRLPPVEKWILIHADWLKKGHHVPKQRLPVEVRRDLIKHLSRDHNT